MSEENINKTMIKIQNVTQEGEFKIYVNYSTEYSTIQVQIGSLNVKKFDSKDPMFETELKELTIPYD